VTGTISGGREAGVEYIELSRPAKRHALTQAMFRLLEQRLRAAEVADEVRVVVLRSDGPVFCAGLDLDEFAAGRADEPDAVADLNRILDTSAAVCGAIAESRKPVIVAAQGPCIGIGLLMFLSADIGLMTPSARLQLPKALIGAGYFAPLLAKLLGPRRAKALLLNPAVTAIGAADAERWGLAAAVLPAEGFRESVRDYAQALARTPAAWLQLQKAGADHLSSSLSVRDAIRAGAHLDAIAHASEFTHEAAQNAFGRPAKSTRKREEENNDRLKRAAETSPSAAVSGPLQRACGPGRAARIGANGDGTEGSGHDTGRAPGTPADAVIRRPGG
jgi:enoyl-CoA hydratase/carnithine racemase